MGWSINDHSFHLGLIIVLGVFVQAQAIYSKSRSKYDLETMSFFGCNQGQIPYCEECAGSYLASNCGRNYASYFGEQGCEPCPPACIKCHLKSTQRPTNSPRPIPYCDLCHWGYTNKGGVCKACDTACWECEVGETQCDGNCTYIQHFGLRHFRYTYNSNTKRCDACAIYCESCEVRGGGKCDDGRCAEGYTLDAGNSYICVECAPSCTKCDTNGRNKCDSGHCIGRTAFNTNNERCDSCAPYCKKCSVPGECDSDQCEEGTVYSAISKGCDRCWYETGRPATKCDKCGAQGGSKCDSSQYCPSGYTIDSLNYCDVCAPSCERCSLPGKCDPGGCKERFTHRNGQCYVCPSNCKTCPSSAVQCTECYPGFRNKNRNTCDRCPDNCLVCVLVGGRARCTNNGCVPKYTEYGGECYSCPGNCLSCSYRVSSKDTGCNLCENKFALDSAAGRCFACPPDCNECRVSGGVTKCLYGRCQAGTVFDHRTQLCRSCPANCLACAVRYDSSVICTRCKNKFASSADKQSCLGCPPNCLQCYVVGGVAKCLGPQCKPEFAFAPSTGSCLNCPSGCLSCTVSGANTVCSGTCLSGWAWSPTSTQCIQCSNCKVCAWSTASSSAKCTTCNDNFVPDTNGLCQNCPPGCPKCTWDTSSSAVVCPATVGCGSGYLQITNKLCMNCPPNCASCSFTGTSLTCTNCKPGYVVYSNRCLPCPSNCDTCTFDSNIAKTTCTSCQTGFAISSGTCAACGQNCGSCGSAGLCNSPCAEGFRHDPTAMRCIQCTVPNCKTCAIVTSTCDICKDKFVLIAGSCQACANDPNCQSCTIAGQCQNCKRKFLLRTDNSGCDACPSGCNFCEYSGGVPVCKYGACLPGFVMKSNRVCLACPNGCAQCEYDTATSTTKCFSGFCKVHFTDNGNGGCTPCPPDCRYCELVGTATRCRDHGCRAEYYMTTAGVCSACSVGCLRCTATACVECKPRYKLNTGTTNCDACVDTNCATCTTNGPNLCDSCDAGYTLTAGNLCAITCATNCLTCTTPGECDMAGCAAGHTYVGGVVPTIWCVPDADYCEPNCGNLPTDCTKSGYQKCDPGHCNLGFGFDPATQKCGGCHPSCSSTRGCNYAGAGNCDANGCTTGIRRWWQKPKLCISVTCSCHASTPYCAVNGQCAFANFCSPNSRYNTGTTACESCSTGCKVCDTAANICDVCHPNYVLTSGTCISCGSNCARCATAGTCVACDAGYRLNGGICEQCTVVGCKACDASAAACEACLDDYNMVSSTSCQGCSAGCLSCVTGSAVCDHCDIGYRLAGSTCLGCGQNCERCSSTGCDKCKAQYYLDSATGNCEKCAENCDVCDHNKKDGCDSCGDGRVWDSDKEACVPCTAHHCSTCDPTDAATCTACESGFELAGTTSCAACPANCLTCALGTCSACLDGFYLSGTACLPCDPHCKTCSGASVCTAANCEEGFEFVGGSCVACKAGCKNGCAAVGGTCLATANCKAGFFHTAGGDCEKCIANCMTCVDATTCTTCATGYEYDTGTTSCKFCPLHTTTSCLTTPVVCVAAAKDVYGTSIYLLNSGTGKCDWGYTNRGCGSATSPPTQADQELCPVGDCQTTYFFHDTGITDRCWPKSSDCTSCTLRNCIDPTNDYCAAGQCAGDSGQTTAGLCVACDPNCLSRQCTVLNSCKVGMCKPGFTAGGTEGPCTPCEANCLRCEIAAGSCDVDSCAPRYAYDGTSTTKCKEVQCAQGNQQVKPDGTGCIPQPVTGCLAPEAKGTTAAPAWECVAEMCSLGYKWSSSSCTACPGSPDCSNCDSNEPLCLNTGCLYSHATTDTGVCAACPVGCTRCTYSASTSSTLCVTNFCNQNEFTELIAAVPICLDCPQECHTCSLSSFNKLRCNSASCNERNIDLPNDENVCYPCSTSCKTCSYTKPRSKCTDCISTYALDGSSYCVGCSTVTSGCAKCSFDSSGTSTILKCDLGECLAEYSQHPTSQICQACPPGCEYCYYDTGTSSTKCFVGGCKGGYYQEPTSLTCYACSGGCLRCKTDALGNNNQCQRQQCEIGYGFVAATETCLSCGTGCASCTVTTSGGSTTATCTACKPKFVIDGSKTCHPCSSDCASCTYDATNSRTICDVCDTGFTQLQNAERTCEKCHQKCVNCIWDTARNALSCTACASDYYVNAQFGCTECPANCATCTNSGVCTSCRSGFYFDTTANVCERCDPNCVRCTVGRGLCDSGQCIGLYAYDSATQTCKACSPNCVSCNIGGKCTQCAPKYVKAPSTNTCYGCPAHCSECNWNNGKSHCNTNRCDATYTVDNNGDCAACPAKCQSCTWSNSRSKTECDNCDTFYGIDAVRGCTKCPRNCTSCVYNAQKAIMACNTCELRFILNDQACGACSKNCRKCVEIQGTMVCEECNPRHYLVTDGTGYKYCEACPQYCSACEANGNGVRCTECIKGAYNFTVSHDRCLPCDTLTTVQNCGKCTEGCARNSNNGICEHCLSGFTMNDNGDACVSCGTLWNSHSCYFTGRNARCNKCFNTPGKNLKLNHIKTSCSPTVKCHVGKGSRTHLDYIVEAVGCKYTVEINPNGGWIQTHREISHVPCKHPKELFQHESGTSIFISRCCYHDYCNSVKDIFREHNTGPRLFLNPICTILPFFLTYLLSYLKS